MSYRYALKFLPTALKEWKKLDRAIQKQLKKKLLERLEYPHAEASRLRGFKQHYKIKLRSSGHRLVYEAVDRDVCVLVIAVGKRDKDSVHKKTGERS